MSPTIVPAPLAGTRDEWPDEDFDLPEGDSILQHIQQQDLEDTCGGRVGLSKPSRPTALRMSTGPEEQDEVEDWDLEGDFTPSSAAGRGMIVAPAFNGGTFTQIGGKGEAVAASKDSEDWDLDLDSAPTIKATSIVKPAVTSTKFPCVSDNPNHAENDEGNTSTIKVSKLTLPSAAVPSIALPLPSVSPRRVNIEDDMEDAFALPDDLSHLSLKPLMHQPSKSTIGEWSSDTTGSMLSDVPSSFGFHDKTASESPTSLPDSGTNTDEEAEVEGLVLPDSFLPKDLARMLEKKKKGQAPLRPKAKLPFPSEDDNPESGLAIQDDSELSPSRLRKTGLSPKVRRVAKTLPSIRPSPTPSISSTIQPPSSITVTKASTHSSTLIAPKLSSRDVRSPSPIVARPASETRMTPISTLTSKPLKAVLPRRPKTGTLSRTKPLSPPPNPTQPVLSHSHSMLFIPRTGPSSPQMSKFLKHQKSTSGLMTSPSSSTFARPDDPKSPSRKGLSRQASLSSLMDSQPNLRSLNEEKHDRNDGVSSRSTSRQSTSATSGLPSLQTRGTIGHASAASYKQHTASSRARGLRTTDSGVIGSDREKGLLHMFPARPTTPSTLASVLRLTLPTTSSRAKMKEKTRVPVSSIFPSNTAHSSSGAVPSSVVAPGGGASSSPTPTSRQSSLSPVQMLRPSGARSPMRMTISSAAKVIRRPKTARTYGDGTELDGIEDLVVEKEKESKYRVTPRMSSSAKIPVEKRTSTVAISRKSGASQTPSEKRPPSSLSICDPPRSAGVPTMARQKSKIDMGVTVPSSNTPTPRLTPAPSPGEYAATRRTRTKSAAQKKPTLIRNLSGVGSPKVVGNMRWNPQSLLWEGNESALKDFDSQAHSARPALITHLTGSSVGGVGSPTGFLGHNARVVGNMIFDPTKMCWINRNVEDEIDPFAGISDDEGNEATWGKNKSATITIRTYRTSAPTAGTPLETVIGSPARSSVSAANRASMAFTTTSESDTDSIEAPSLVGSASAVEGSPPRRFERGASTSPAFDVHEALVRMSRQAEERHRKEVRGWLLSPTRRNCPAADEDDDVKVDRSYLFEIRELATRKYSS